MLDELAEEFTSKNPQNDIHILGINIEDIQENIILGYPQGRTEYTIYCQVILEHNIIEDVHINIPQLDANILEKEIIHTLTQKYKKNIEKATRISMLQSEVNLLFE